MPFGMQNAPATFQCVINTIRAGMKQRSAYLDDLVIHTTTWDDHFISRHTLFGRLVDAILTVNLAKCEFVKASSFIPR